MYRVLLPIDTDENRVSAQTTAVIGMARAAEEVEVTLLYVFEDRERAESTSPTQLPTGEQARDRLVEAGVGVEERSAAGDPATEIIAAAEAIGVDGIVLGGRKRSSLGALVFGSVSQEVTLNATQPVTVTGSAEDLDSPSHRCADCGETYYTSPETEIGTCRNCGGVNVERVPDDAEGTRAKAH